MDSPIIAPANIHTLYHGTNRDFDDFSVEYLGQNTEWPNSYRGIHFTNEIGIAQLFGDNVLECQVNIQKPLNLIEIFNIADQAPDIVDIIFEENISDPDEALEFIDDSISLGEYIEFMNAFNEEDTLTKFKERGYDHIISRFSKDKFEYCIFDPSKITIMRKDLIASFPQNEYLTVLPANSRQTENIIKVLKSMDEREINLLCKLLRINLESIPNKIDGYEIDNLKKLRILAGKDNIPGSLSYSINKGKLYRELPEYLNGKSPVLKLSADKIKKQGLRISRKP